MKYVMDDLASFKVKHAMDGVSVTMNSTIIEAYFKRFSQVEKSPYEIEWDGYNPYSIPSTITRYYQNCLSPWRNQCLYFANDRPNMSFLRCEGLKDGIEVIIKMPCSEAYLERYKKMLGKTILAFYYSEIEPAYNQKAIKIPNRYKDIYHYLDFRGYTMESITSSKLTYLQDCLKGALKDLNITQNEIKRRLNSHVA